MKRRRRRPQSLAVEAGVLRHRNRAAYAGNLHCFDAGASRSAFVCTASESHRSVLALETACLARPSADPRRCGARCGRCRPPVGPDPLRTRTADRAAALRTLHREPHRRRRGAPSRHRARGAAHRRRYRIARSARRGTRPDPGAQINFEKMAGDEVFGRTLTQSLAAYLNRPVRAVAGGSSGVISGAWRYVAKSGGLQWWIEFELPLAASLADAMLGGSGAICKVRNRPACPNPRRKNRRRFSSRALSAVVGSQHPLPAVWTDEPLREGARAACRPVRRDHGTLRVASGRRSDGRGRAERAHFRPLDGDALRAAGVAERRRSQLLRTSATSSPPPAPASPRSWAVRSRSQSRTSPKSRRPIFRKRRSASRSPPAAKARSSSARNATPSWRSPPASSADRYPTPTRSAAS